MSPRKAASRRRAAATVEFAICLPVLVTLLFAGLDASSLFRAKEALAVVSYEACRHATSGGRTSADVEAFAAGVAKNVYHGPVRLILTPQEVGAAKAGEPVTVQVQGSVTDRALFLPRFFKLDQVQSSCTMLKESYYQERKPANCCWLACVVRL